MRNFYIPILLLLQANILFAQQTSKDSVQILEEVTVKAYEQNRKLMQVPAAIAVISKPQLLRFTNTNIIRAGDPVQN